MPTTAVVRSKRQHKHRVACWRTTLDLTACACSTGERRPDKVDLIQIGIILFCCTLFVGLTAFAVYHFVAKSNNADDDR
eukprot:SAG31_NODE_1571_length_7851_cov_8.714525_14_plen_79_part_00